MSCTVLNNVELLCILLTKNLSRRKQFLKSGDINLIQSINKYAYNTLKENVLSTKSHKCKLS